jgi:hypothetical protein
LRVSRGRGGFEDISRAGLRGFRARVTRHTVSIRFFGGGIFMATLPSRCVSRGGVRVQASTIDETRSNCFSSRRERSRSSAFASRSAPSALRARIADAEARSERTRAGCASPASPLAPRAGSCDEPSLVQPQVPSLQFRAAVQKSHFRVSSRLTQQPDPPVQTRAPWTAREGTRRPHDGRRERCAPWARPVPRERHPHRAPMPRPSTAAVPIRRGVRFQRRIPFRFRVSAANALTSSPA